MTPPLVPHGTFFTSSVCKVVYKSNKQNIENSNDIETLNEIKHY